MGDENQFLNLHGMKKYNSVLETRISKLERQIKNITNTFKIDMGLKIDVSDEGVYGFHIDGNNPNPYEAVTYLCDAVGMLPAYMDYQNNIFRYGSWRNVWFIKECKPCIMNQDGTIECYLNPNDYYSDIDGNYVDLDNLTDQNVMIEFPEIWYKVVPDYNNDSSGSVYFSKYKVDEDFHNYAYIDKNGVSKEHFYIGAYKGFLKDNTLYSKSNISITRRKTITDFISYAKNNGEGWNIEDIGERMLINLLLILIGKSLNSQEVFGRSRVAYDKRYKWVESGGRYYNDWNNLVPHAKAKTGSLNKNGLFYGTDASSQIKIFGIENYYGFLWEFCLGDILKNGNRLIKMSYLDSETIIGENEDGNPIYEQNISDYNIDGSGYTNISASPTGSNGSFITKLKFNEFGIFPYAAPKGVATGSTYCCDQISFNNTITACSLYGGALGNETSGVGIFRLYLSLANNKISSAATSRLSYK